MSEPPRRRRGRQLTEDERRLWDYVTASVTPKGRVRAKPVGPAAEPDPPPPPAPAPTAPRARTVVKPAGRAEAPVSLPAAPPLHEIRLDGKRAERFRKGELEIDARIDLHGMTLEVAHAALGGFLVQARARGARCVIVITGKGFPTGEGALRRFVPRWMAEAPLAAMIAGVAPAQPRHGGGGALYVYLRRKRL